MRTDLLESLAVALSELDDDSGFDMNQWATKLPESSDLKCGTSACAIGLASTLPDWKEAGLEMVNRFNGKFGGRFYDVFVPTFKGQTEFHAVASLLDISILEAQALFDPCFYNDDVIEPYEVIERIENFIHGDVT